MRLSTLVLVAAGAAVVLIIYRRGKTMARLSAHFDSDEFRSRGRPLAPGTEGLYAALAGGPLEYARSVAADVAGEPVYAEVLSGQRLDDHNADVDGKGGSYHLPPADRKGPSRLVQGVAADLRFYRVRDRSPLTGAQHAQVAAAVLSAMRTRQITPGGVHAYHTDPGAAKAPFVHIDNRGTIATW